MRLKEFGLDLPYIANEKEIQLIMDSRTVSREEASRIYYESNWKTKRRKFRLETRCITAMFERICEKIEQDDCWKILVECVEEVSDKRILNFSGIVTVQVKLDFTEFKNSSELHKKQLTLKLLYEGIQAISQEKQWDITYFQSAYNYIKNSGYINEWIWKKPKRSPNKSLTAEVFCIHNVNNMDIYIILKDKRGIEVKREKIISELPDEYVYCRHLGELKWLSDTEIALINKKGDAKFCVCYE